VSTPEQYTIKKQLLRLFGEGFEIEDATGALVGFGKQKAFRLREDLRVFTDKSATKELLRIAGRSIIDFGATYDILTPDGHSLGSIRRKGLSSAFFRDSWLIFDADGAQIGTLREDSGAMGLVRRFVPYANLFFPEKFEIHRLGPTGEPEGAPLATIRQHFNLLFYRLGIAILVKDEHFDDLLILGMACLIASIEGRQQSWD